MKKNKELIKLESLVEEAYLSKDPSRDEWADWIYPNHVLVVADYAEKLAERYGASIDESRSVALLHDIADSVTGRTDHKHETRSLEIAADYLRQSGFDKERIKVLVNDALRFHSCHDGNGPKSQVGKVLSTADALAHINTDFYEFVREDTSDRPNDWFINWITEKLPRDYEKKIAFEDIREETRSRYEELIQRYTKNA